jgi:hypothetical protein
MIDYNPVITGYYKFMVVFLDSLTPEFVTEFYWHSTVFLPFVSLLHRCPLPGTNCLCACLQQHPFTSENHLEAIYQAYH